MILHDGVTYTVVKYTPLYTSPRFNSSKQLDLLDGTLVKVTEFRDEHIDGVLWRQVSHQTNLKTYTGWLPDFLIEPFLYDPIEYGIIKIKNPTKDSSDFNQNIFYLGNTQYNLCGEFCVLYCAGWFNFIEDWLDIWRSKSVSVFNRIFRGGKSTTTGIPDLNNMFQSFDGYPKNIPLISDVFKYKGAFLFTPFKLSKVLWNNYIIVGCKIEPRFGRLKSSGIPHWVVIVKMELNQRGGLVYIYNPASNSIETYAWDDFLLSVTKNPYGIVVERT